MDPSPHTGPDSASTTAPAADPVARALLPVLLHGVNNATQLLVGLRALLDIPGGDALFAQRSEDLGAASTAMYDHGFALAVVSTAGGANMLMARRHAGGIGILWGLALQSEERTGETRVACTGTPPAQRSTALDGWQLPWSAAALFLLASNADGAEAWRWAWGESGELTGQKSGEPTGLSQADVAAVAERVPGARIELEGATLRWSAPAEWLDLDGGPA